MCSVLNEWQWYFGEMGLLEIDVMEAKKYRYRALWAIKTTKIFRDVGHLLHLIGESGKSSLKMPRFQIL